MRLHKLSTLVGAAVAAAMLLCAAPAHADRDTFLDRVNNTPRARGLFAVNDGMLVALGMRNCVMMRGGMTPEDIGAYHWATWDMDAVLFARIAHDELCPDA